MRKLLFITVFFSGLVSLGTEMTASRLLNNYFGNSNLIWASIIGLILIYLTVGYFLGGKWADRSPHSSTFFRILIWAAFTVGLVPLVAYPILGAVRDAFNTLRVGVLAGSFVSVLVLFLVPITLLGTASPFAIRLALSDSRSAGRVSGQIYAVSTLGSFAGTFLPVLVLIPLVGTFRTFLVLAALLLVVAIVGLWHSSGVRAIIIYLWMPLILLLLAFIGPSLARSQESGLIFETESAYNDIQVIEQDGYRLLRLNEGQGVHSIYHPDVLFYRGPWEQVLVAPFFNPGFQPEAFKSMAIIGLAAGTTARQATAVFGADISIDGFEIDPEIVAAGRKFFDMNQPNLHVFVEDGRVGLDATAQRYQVISVDAYRPPYIPPHLVTREFFQSVRAHLTDDGVMVINVGRGPEDRRLVEALSSTILTVFPSVHVMDIPETYNSILFATVSPTTTENLLKNYNEFSQPKKNTHPLLIQAAQITLANLQPQPAPGLVFTDDRAPIEWITNSLILGFMLANNGETPP